MFSKTFGLIGAWALACAPLIGSAATFDVANPAEFQAALTAAQSNGQNDVINVLECAGAGCIVVDSVSAHNIATPLTYTAAATETFSLTIDGFDSDTRGLVGASNNGILFIDTTAASDDFAAEIVVKGLTFASGNNVGPPADGGALSIVVNSPSVEVSGSVFFQNAADGNGGALFIQARGAGELPIQIYDVTFDSNSAGLDGGGAYVSASNSHLVDVFNVSFFDNDAANGGGLKIAGFDPLAIGLNVMAVQLDDYDFYDNIARSGDGGGADIDTNDLDVGIGGFVRNISTNGSGGGLYLRSNFLRFFMVNAGFTGNTAGFDGGGFATESNMGPVVTITNNTIYANSAVGLGGGAKLIIGGSTGLGSIYNNIIYSNDTDAASGRDIYIDNDPFSDIPVSIDFFNNDITDLTGFPDANLYFEIVDSSVLNSGANIDGMPLLPQIGDINPSPAQAAGSPTIDAGTLSAPGLPSFDFEGDPRPTIAPGLIDIGMDEFVGGAVPEADLGVTKTDSPDPVTGGNDVTYTVTVTNNGPDAATGVTVTDTLDQAVTLVSAVFNQGTPCTTAGTPVVITCVLGDLAANNSAPGTIVVTSPVVTTVGGIANSVTVSGNETDPSAANNTAQQGTTVVPEAGPAQADLAITMVDTPDPIISGGPQLTYTITVDNNGPDAATAVTVSDTLPAGVTFVSASASAGQCDAMPDMAGTLACGLGDLASGSNATVTVVVKPLPVTTQDTLSNSATVAATEADPDTGDNTVTETTTVDPPASDMSVAASSTSGTPLIGEPVSYALTVTNNGPSDNTGVVVTVNLPASATFDSVTIDQGTCEPVNGAVVCTIGDMAAGATVTGQILLTAPGEPMMLTLSATIVADVSDPDTSNNADSADVMVIDVVDLVIQGTSEGTGSLHWLTILSLLVFTGLVACKNKLRHGAPLAFVSLALLGLLLPAGEAQAQSDWYVGASVGQGGLDYSAGDLTQDLANLGWSINNPSVNDSGTAWKAYLGFTVNEYFAVEAGYADLGKVVTQFGATIPPTQINAILSDTFRIHPYQGDGWFGAAVLNWPVSPDRVNVFARLGLFGWESDLDVRVISGGTGSITDRESGTDTMYGVGVEWRINEQWSVTGEWERYKLNEWLDVPSIGLRFTF